MNLVTVQPTAPPTIKTAKGKMPGTGEEAGEVQCGRSTPRGTALLTSFLRPAPQLLPLASFKPISHIIVMWSASLENCNSSKWSSDPRTLGTLGGFQPGDLLGNCRAQIHSEHPRCSRLRSG